MIRNVATSGVHSNLLRWSVHKWQHPVTCFCNVGLIDERLEMECAGDFCTDDAMPWDETRSPGSHAGPVESLTSLLKWLKLYS
ncbi:hypothetical protein B5K12_15550 [Klebsiella pneumoniae subsp. pneumoniae]|nr:hypothetical protein RJA_16645 [Klebsiella pneumoniae subsp. pneumoniae]OKG92300.1 hypothetical protein [Klebsiella pneumoniae]OSP32748.1 hypothetical protein B5U79_21880 [Klebsiella pneumoniae]OVX60734.1 hypothetical protein BME24_22790 [Klebsiella pneumoniae]OWU95334.1 hypothetical protein B5K12_15550 [Klebsiella pneumoniae subsp. pneumoniae]